MWKQGKVTRINAKQVITVTSNSQMKNPEIVNFGKKHPRNVAQCHPIGFFFGGLAHIVLSEGCEITNLQQLKIFRILCLPKMRKTVFEGVQTVFGVTLTKLGQVTDHGTFFKVHLGYPVHQ